MTPSPSRFAFYMAGLQVTINGRIGVTAEDPASCTFKYNGNMPLTITEVFGYSPDDQSPLVKEIRTAGTCPFTSKRCIKTFRDSGVLHGTCTVKTPSDEEVICCPKRLYAEKYRILTDVALEAFGPELEAVIPPSEVEESKGQKGRAVAFGSGWGKELRVPKSGDQKGSYSADWILALISEANELIEFVALEVQSMDTTGDYQPEWCSQMGVPYTPYVAKKKKKKSSNINWENVNKRIIPQLLTKGNVFQRENLCRKGMFFVTPTPVYKRVIGRLGTKLSEFPLQPSGLTFRYYGLKPSSAPATIRELAYEGQYTTTVENLKEAFNSTLNLPPMNSITAKIQKALQSPKKLKQKPNEEKETSISG